MLRANKHKCDHQMQHTRTNAFAASCHFGSTMLHRSSRLVNAEP